MTGIRDLARHLDISIGTVSRALNNRPDVNPETRRRVLDAARELGYVPNQAGRSLRQGSSDVVGFVVETDAASMMEGDLFFLRVMSGMQSVIADYGLNVVALISPASEERHDYLQGVVARRFTDALVLSSVRRQDPRISYLADAGVPFVTLGRSETEGGQPWLDLDFEGMVGDAMDRLAGLGHKRIALAMPETDVNLGQIMRKSYRDGLSRWGLPFAPELIFRISSTNPGGPDLAPRILATPDRPTAVIFSDAVWPFGLYSGLAQAGLTPGKDLSILGFGTRLADNLVPKLSYYRFSLVELGRRIGFAVLGVMPDRRLLESEEPERDIPVVVADRAPFWLVDGDTLQPPPHKT